jgi:hypothetical protein
MINRVGSDDQFTFHLKYADIRFGTDYVTAMNGQQFQIKKCPLPNRRHPNITAYL